MKTTQRITGILLLITLPGAQALSRQQKLIFIGSGIGAAILLAVLTYWCMMRRRRRLNQKARARAEAARTAIPQQQTLEIPIVVITLAESPQVQRAELPLAAISELKASVIVNQSQNSPCSHCGVSPEFVSGPGPLPVLDYSEPPPYESLYSFMKQENVNKAQTHL